MESNHTECGHSSSSKGIRHIQTKALSAENFDRLVQLCQEPETLARGMNSFNIPPFVSSTSIIQHPCCKLVSAYTLDHARLCAMCFRII